jgi:microcystin-dependent protein
MLPRAQMLSAPYALKSAVANDAVSAFNGVPPGSILPFGGTNVPSEFLLCDGTTVSRTTYARLYAAIGSAWGAGDGYNTFNLPDLRGYFLRGVDTLGGTDPDRAARTNRSGQIVGSVVGSLQADSFKSHNHSTGVRQENHAGGGWQSLANPTTINVQLPSSFTGGAETRPKYAYVNYIIKY